jgi:hypothetical protein
MIVFLIGKLLVVNLSGGEGFVNGRDQISDHLHNTPLLFKPLPLDYSFEGGNIVVLVV